MISCKEYVLIQKERLKEKINGFERRPRLVVVQVGNDLGSNSYIRSKRKSCEEVGIELEHVHIADYENVSQQELELQIRTIDECKMVDGIIVQLPIPDKYDVENIQNCISPIKDVDGFRIDSFHKPCTPKGIMDWLKFNNYEFEGKVTTVFGRSKIVGKPMANMLIEEGATTICCNSKTRELEEWMKISDLCICAIGKPKFFCGYFKEGAIVVDVGINRDSAGKLCGDVDRECLEKHHDNVYVTPVPGGVGLLTVVTLLKNVIEAYERRM